MIRVGVFFGGSSSEREVSLEGGRNVFRQLDQKKYDRVAIFVDAEYRFWRIPETLIIQNTTADLSRLVEAQAERISYERLKECIDFAFVTGHGKYMEDGCLQGLFELLKIPYNGPGVLGASLGMNKYVQRIMLRAAGIDVPKSILARVGESGIAELILAEVGFPCVVKPTREGCSTAIGVVKSKDELAPALEKSFAWDADALIEEHLQGMEVTVSVLGNETKKALPVTETPWGKNLGYLTLEDKFLPGGAEMITPARISPELTKRVQDTAIKVCETLNLVGYPRIDMFIVPKKDNGERIVVLEPNTLPGITPSTMVFHQAAEAGMTPSQFLDRIITLGLDAHRNKKGPL